MSNRVVSPPKRTAASGKKDSISVTLDHDLLDWVRSRSGPGGEFASISHALERGITCLRNQETRDSLPEVEGELAKPGSLSHVLAHCPYCDKKHGHGRKSINGPVAADCGKGQYMLRLAA